MVVTSPAESRPTPRSLRHNRDFALLWAGQATSQMGSQMSTVAYPLLVLAFTGSAAQAGIVASATLISTLVFLLPAGVFADRLPRKRILVTASLVQMAAGATVVPAVLTHHVYLVHLAAVGVIQGVAGAFYLGASKGAIRRIVDPDQLPAAMAATQARTRAAIMVGPPAGGALFSVARFLPFAVDAVSFGMVSLAAALLRKPLDPGCVPAREPLRRSITTGIRFVGREPFLRMFAIWAAVLNGAVFGVQLTVIVLARNRGANPVEIGTLLSISASCGLAGALLATQVIKLASGRALTLICSWTFAAASLGMIFVPSIWLIAVLAGLTGFALMPVNVLLTARSARITPDHLQAQTSNALTLCYSALSAFTPAVFGALTDKFGPYPVIGLATVVYTLLALWLQSSRRLHDLDSEPAPATEPATATTTGAEPEPAAAPAG